MSARVCLLRHGKTAGNLEGRYIGVTDEPLCEEGRRALLAMRLPAAERVYTSPLLRCRQTAELLWPGTETVQIPEFSECDFGEFENRNYAELNGNPAYQAWIDSGGTIAFPGGEDPLAFRARCVRGFERAMEDLKESGKKNAAVVCHGGTIMSILAVYGRPKRPFYGWQVKNGRGFLLELLDDRSPKEGVRILREL